MLAPIPNCLFYFIIIFFKILDKINPVIPKTWRQSQYVQERSEEALICPVSPSIKYDLPKLQQLWWILMCQNVFFITGMNWAVWCFVKVAVASCFIQKCRVAWWRQLGLMRSFRSDRSCKRTVFRLIPKMQIRYCIISVLSSWRRPLFSASA